MGGVMAMRRGGLSRSPHAVGPKTPPDCKRNLRFGWPCYNSDDGGAQGVSERSREQWTGRAGFVMAAVGSAVGLGNMWRFSYLTAENGGAAFVLLYLALTLVIGLPVLLAELIVGRGSGRSPIGALGHYGGRAWRPLGGLFVASGFLILSYYSVIAGWTLRYGLDALMGGFAPGAADYFVEVREGASAIAWHVVFMGVTMLIVARGVRAGIERTSLVLMPLLFLLVCGMAVYAFTLDGAGAGYRFYLQTDFQRLLERRLGCDQSKRCRRSVRLEGKYADTATAECGCGTRRYGDHYVGVPRRSL